MPARLIGVLTPIITDADWEPQFEFFEEATTNPQNFAGWGASLVLVRQMRGAPGEHDRIVLDTDAGSMTWLDGHTLVAAPARAALVQLAVGVWHFELRLRDGNDAIDVWLTGMVNVIRGLSQIAAGDPVAGSAQSSAGGVGTVQIVRTAAGVQIVSGQRGRKGEPADGGDGGAVSIEDVDGLADALAANAASDAALDGRLDTAEGKLAGIASGATVNASDAQLRDRATHTGTQGMATVIGLEDALDAKASLASPAFTGVPTAPTPSPGTSSTQIATMAALAVEIQAVIGMAPDELNTIAEIAEKLATDDENYAALVATIAGKMAKAANLSDLADVVEARANLGLASAATQPASAFQAASTVLAFLAGAGSANAAGVKALLALAKADVGLSNAPNLKAHPGYRSGCYYTSDRATSSYTAVAADTLYATPIQIKEAMTADQLALRVNAGVAASTALAGIYDDAGGRPNVLVAQASAALSTAAFATPVSGTFSASPTLQPGWYWLASLYSGAPTMQCIAASDTTLNNIIGSASFTEAATNSVGLTGLSAARTYASGLPATFGAAAVRANAVTPLLYLRAA